MQDLEVGDLCWREVKLESFVAKVGEDPIGMVAVGSEDERNRDLQGNQLVLPLRNGQVYQVLRFIDAEPVFNNLTIYDVTVASFTKLPLPRGSKALPKNGNARLARLRLGPQDKQTYIQMPK